MSQDLSRLKSNLANGKMREMDFPTYQVINALINEIAQLKKELEIKIVVAEGIINAITQLTGDVTAGPGSGSQIATIVNDVVTYGKIQNVSAAERLLGRGDSGAGDVQELTIGPGLDITGTILDVTGSGEFTWDVLTDGDLIETELIYANGEVIMLHY